MRFYCFEELIKTPWNDFFAPKNLCGDFFVILQEKKVFPGTFCSLIYPGKSAPRLFREGFIHKNHQKHFFIFFCTGRFSDRQILTHIGEVVRETICEISVIRGHIFI
jgi:hypothetical protein